jgi:hypothetical protein
MSQHAAYTSALAEQLEPRTFFTRVLPSLIDDPSWQRAMA